MAWTHPKTWNTNDVLTAGDMNTYVRDNFRAIGVLQAYTPAWTATVSNPVIGNGVIQGRYVDLEEWCWVSIVISAGTTTTYGSGSYEVTLPVAASTLAGGVEQNFPAVWNNLGVARYTGLSIMFSGATKLSGWYDGVGVWSPTAPFTMGTSDTFQTSGMYRKV